MMSTFLVEDEARRKNNFSRIRRAVKDNLAALDDTDVTRSSEAVDRPVHAPDSSSGEDLAGSLVDRKDMLSNGNTKQSESAERNGAIELSAMFAENPLRTSALPTSSSAKAGPRVTFLAESSAEVGNVGVDRIEELSAMFHENSLRTSALPTSSRTKAEPRATFLAESNAEVGKIDVGTTETVSAATAATSETTSGAGAVHAASTETVVVESASKSKWIKVATEAGEPYYYDQISGKASWEAPPGSSFV